MNRYKDSIGLNSEQRASLLRLCSAYHATLNQDFKNGVEPGWYWHVYFEKLWLAAEREAGNKQITIPGHRRQTLREIEKIHGHWPSADEALKELMKGGVVDEMIVEAIRRDVARQHSSRTTKKGGKK